MFVYHNASWILPTLSIFQYLTWYGFAFSEVIWWSVKQPGRNLYGLVSSQSIVDIRTWSAKLNIFKNSFNFSFNCSSLFLVKPSLTPSSATQTPATRRRLGHMICIGVHKRGISKIWEKPNVTQLEICH